MAATEPYVPNQLYYIFPDVLLSDPEEPRQYMDPQGLAELTVSVRRNGIVEPILARQDKATGLLHVVSGKRRLAAARQAGIEAVPVIFIDGDNCSEIAIVENLHRQDLIPVEEAEALDRFMKKQSYKQEDLMKILGKSQSSVSETLSLNRLPEGIRDECRKDPTVPKRVLVEIARAKQERGMFSLYRAYREKEAAQKAKEAGQTVETPRKTPSEALLAAMVALVNRIGMIDLAAWSEEAREEFKTVIADINGIAEEKLALCAAAVPGTDQPEEET